MLDENNLGFLCKNIESLVEKLDFLITNPEILENLQKNNRRFSSKQFDINEIVKQYDILFKNILCLLQKISENYIWPSISLLIKKRSNMVNSNFLNINIL